jgi:type II secretory pathway component PulK
MDSFEEIRLIDGWEGAVFEKFGDRLTIWSNGKFNLNSVDNEMHKAVIRSAATTPVNDAMLENCMTAGDSLLGTAWDIARIMRPFSNAKYYVDFVKDNCGIELNKSKLKNLTNTSKVFTLTSTGFAGDSQVTITTVIDFSKKSTGQTKYWRIE